MHIKEEKKRNNIFSALKELISLQKLKVMLFQKCIKRLEQPKQYIKDNIYIKAGLKFSYKMYFYSIPNGHE